MVDFDKTLNADDPSAVTTTTVLPTVAGGLTYFPLVVEVKGPGDANRLLIFSGIAKANLHFDVDDDHLRVGPVRVRLMYTLPDSVNFISSSTTAALADIVRVQTQFNQK